MNKMKRILTVLVFIGLKIYELLELIVQELWHLLKYIPIGLDSACIFFWGFPLN